MKRFTICATGHRKLYGYDLHDQRWLELGRRMRSFLLKKLEERKALTCISGMALGTDQLFALVALKIRDEGGDVKIVAALPCRNQNAKWKDDRYYQDILKRVDETVFVHDGEYAPFCMDKRNRWMVDHSDLVLAVFNGSNGGTANTINYARGKIEIHNMLEEKNERQTDPHSTIRISAAKA